ncbi:hypothetical protein SAY87_008106 [Trapa incisa]|uniref:Uncharacterized protein n=1 Tax=Trapa incisa TaxID=236973 RepID=A0AAN7KFH9_9MYRT|nr:hypothetical protein SAY87_008106 [Trapa incisa]
MLQPQVSLCIRSRKASNHPGRAVESPPPSCDRQLKAQNFQMWWRTAERHSIFSIGNVGMAK